MSEVDKSTAHERLTGEPTMVQSIPYETLTREPKQIRLLHIQPADQFDDHLICTLSTVSFQEPERPKYIAISYVWGSTEPPHYIIVNGRSIPVGGNCHYALQQARYFNPGSLAVWIDAICINQVDDAEKSDQISFMHEIYLQADYNFSCVGPESKDADDSIMFEQLNRLGVIMQEQKNTQRQECQLCMKYYHTSREYWVLHSIHLWADEMGVRTASTHDTLLSILTKVEHLGRREYWTRMWILQEVLPASSAKPVDRVVLLCGLRKVPLAPLFAIGTLETRMYLQQLNHLPSRMVWSLGRNPLGAVCMALNRGFYGTLSSKGLVCSNVLDRVWSLIHLFPWPGGKPAVDYSKSSLEIAADVLQRGRWEEDYDFTISRTLKALGVDARDLFFRSTRNHTIDHSEDCKQSAPEKTGKAKFRSARHRDGNSSPVFVKSTTIFNTAGGSAWACLTRVDRPGHHCLKLRSGAAFSAWSTIGEPLQGNGDTLYILGELKAGDFLLAIGPLGSSECRPRHLVVVRSSHSDYFAVVGFARAGYLRKCRDDHDCPHFKRIRDQYSPAPDLDFHIDVYDAITLSLVYPRFPRDILYEDDDDPTAFMESRVFLEDSCFDEEEGQPSGDIAFHEGKKGYWKTCSLVEEAYRKKRLRFPRTKFSSFAALSEDRDPSTMTLPWTPDVSPLPLRPHG